MSIESNGPSAEEMGIGKETEKQTFEVTGSATKDEIMSNYRAAKLTSFQTAQGEIQVYIERISGDKQLSIQGAASGSVSGEIEMSYDPATGKGTATVSKSEAPNPFAG